MKILTVVVPMYNIEKYIHKCLDSFIIEEIISKIEVIIIDDGSTDNSYNIAKEYEKKYPNLFRLITKENAGHGSAVNKGILEAKGIYFKIVDADDWVDKKTFVKFIKVLSDTDVDLVLSNYNWVDYQTGKVSFEVDNICDNIVYEKQYLAKDVLKDTFLKMHSITYKTSILKQNNIRLTHNCFYVDMEYVLYPLPYINTVLYMKESIYQYLVGLPSQSMSIDNMKKRCNQHELVLNNLLIYYKKNIKNHNTLAMEKLIARMITSQYKIYLLSNFNCKNKLVSLDKKIKKEYPMVYCNIKNKVIIFLRKSNYMLYDIVSYFIRKYYK